MARIYRAVWLKIPSLISFLAQLLGYNSAVFNGDLVSDDCRARWANVFLYCVAALVRDASMSLILMSAKTVERTLFNERDVVNNHSRMRKNIAVFRTVRHYELQQQ